MDQIITQTDVTIYKSGLKNVLITISFYLKDGINDERQTKIPGEHGKFHSESV